MTQEKGSNLTNLLDEWDKTTTLSFELLTYSLLVSEKGLRLDISCKQMQQSMMRGQQFVKGKKLGFQLDKLPVTLRLVQVPSNEKPSEVIGELTFFDAISSEDDVFDSWNRPVTNLAGIEGVIGVTSTMLDSVVTCLSGVIAAWEVSLDVLGLDRTEDRNKMWDASINSKIAVTRLALGFRDKQLPNSQAEDKTSPLTLLTRIEERVVAIEKRIETGIKVRLF